jgi:hypothetical protein
MLSFRKVTSGVCSCGWVDLEQNMANSNKKMTNLFTYKMCDLEDAQVCKAGNAFFLEVLIGRALSFPLDSCCVLTELAL